MWFLVSETVISTGSVVDRTGSHGDETGPLSGVLENLWTHICHTLPPLDIRTGVSPFGVPSPSTSSTGEVPGVGVRLLYSVLLRLSGPTTSLSLRGSCPGPRWVDPGGE